MSMKTSVVVADGTFPTATAPLLGQVDTVFRQAAALGYDAVSITVNHPKDVNVDEILSAMKTYGVAVSGLATGRICGADGYSISSAEKKTGSRLWSVYWGILTSAQSSTQSSSSARFAAEFRSPVTGTRMKRSFAKAWTRSLLTQNPNVLRSCWKP